MRSAKRCIDFGTSLCGVDDFIFKIRAAKQREARRRRPGPSRALRAELRGSEAIAETLLSRAASGQEALEEEEEDEGEERLVQQQAEP